MMTRRRALQTLAYSTGAMALATHAQQPAPPVNPQGEPVFKLPPLGYDYDALEPYLDAETMKLHHDKHHAAYVSKLNQSLARYPAEARKGIDALLPALDSLPAEIREDVRQQGGGHANHTLFWQTLRRNDGAKPGDTLGQELGKAFGSYHDFWTLFATKAMGVFGSGWTWLVWRDRKLSVETTADQDSPLLTGGYPLLGLDGWEHAYYLKYQNRRAEYVAAFQNVIHWAAVEERFAKRTLS